MELQRTTRDFLMKCIAHLIKGDALMKDVCRGDLAHVSVQRYNPFISRDPSSGNFCHNCDEVYGLSETSRCCDGCTWVLNNFDEYPSVVYHDHVQAGDYESYIISRCYIDDFEERFQL